MGVFFRFPLHFYRLNLGWLLGGRFLLLIHTGRKSGLERRTVVEVVRYDANRDAYTIAAAWGERSDWYRNIVKNRQVRIQVGRRHTAATAFVLQPEEAIRELNEYAQAHPFAYRVLFKMLLGFDGANRMEELQQAAQEIPLVRLAAGRG